MAKALILAWQNDKNHRWTAIGRLSYHEETDKYTFCYTQAAKNAYENNEFTQLFGMDEISKTYESGGKPLPIFQNRLLRKTRPEYDSYLQWLGIKDEKLTAIKELELSGGIRATDNYQLFPVPTNGDGYYNLKFFVHGIRHLPENYIKRVESINTGDRLLLMDDRQNQADLNAVALRTEDPPEIVGYIPSFFTSDIKKLLEQNKVSEVYVNVVQVNMDAPSQFRMQCELKTKWPQNFVALDHELIQPAT